MAYLLTIKLDTESIVELLLKHAKDWGEALYFIKSYADSQGYMIDEKEISKQVRQKLFGA